MNSPATEAHQAPQIIERLTELLAYLADAGDVDESREIQRVIDRLYPVSDEA